MKIISIKKRLSKKTGNKGTRLLETSSVDLFTAHTILHWQVLIALILMISFYLILGYYFQYGIVDDAYISLRYAKNFAEGKGLVFNFGERVEGYTNFLWTLLLALGFFFRLDGVNLSIALGVLTGCSLLILLFFLTRHHFAPRTTIYRSIAAPLCVAMQLPFLCYSKSGLESNFFTVCLIGSIYFIFMGMRKAYWYNYASLTLALGSLTRPEANVIFFFSLLFIVWYRRYHQENISLSTILSYIAIYVFIVGSFLWWRYSYYGFWLPNTYYVKVGGGVNLSLIKNGVDYVWRFSLLTYLIVVLPLVAVVSYFRREPKLTYLLGVTCVYLAAIIYEGGDHLAMFRFCVPLIAIVALFYQEMWAYCLIYIFKKRSFLINRFYGLTLFMSVVLLTGLSSSLRIYRAPSMHGLTEYERSMLEVKLAEEWAHYGRWLKKNTRGDEKIALITAGAIPFYSGLYTIDMAGLTDTHIAHMPIALGMGYMGHEKFDNEYVLSQRPHFILAHHLVQFGRYIDESTYNSTAYFKMHRELVRMPELQGNYHYRCVKAGPHRFYCYYVLRTYDGAGSTHP